MLTKKGQLSIETMILYGLIALVALSAVAALIYFHVLDLGRYLPDTCDLGGSGDLKCEEVRVSGANGNIIEFGIRNVAQKNIADLQITLNETARIHLSSLAEGNYSGSIAPGQIVKVTINLTDAGNIGFDGVSTVNVGKVKQGNIFEAKIFTSYRYSDGAITQEASGSMKVKAS